jgi:hypothetical protein
MVNRNYPTYANIQSQRISTTYQVLSYTPPNVVLRNDKCFSLQLGELLDLNNGDICLINEVTESLAKGILIKNVGTLDNSTAANASRREWLSIPQPQVVALDESIGSLYVALINTQTDLPGYVGWTLFNSNNEPLLMGNDYANHNVCKYDSEGEWPAGQYYLEARSFLRETMQPINYVRQDIYLQTATELISIGNYSDNTPRLVMN